MTQKRSFIFYIVLDAFGFKAINRKINESQLTPFLHNNPNIIFSGSNVYSPAPYTEAAMVSVLGNILPLENGGYLLGNYCLKNTLPESISKKGYTTYYTLAPYIADQSYLKSFDKYLYTSIYSIQPLLNYRLKYYRQLLAEKRATINDLKICQFLLEDALFTWKNELEEIKQSALSTILLPTIQNAALFVDKLKREISLFKNNKIEYTAQLLNKLNEPHPLILLDKVIQTQAKRNTPPQLEENISKSILAEQKRISEIIRNSYNFSNYKNYIFKTILSRGPKAGIHLWKAIRNYQNYKLLSESLSSYKNKTSLKQQLNFFSSLLFEKNTDSIFAYIHADDFHLPSVFYDTSNPSNISEDLASSLEILKSISRDYYGNPVADLSASYCSKCLEDFFKSCIASEENVTMIISADHGYPLFQTPLRDQIYNQTYSDAYHIPYIILSTQPRNKLTKLQRNNDLLLNIDLQACLTAHKSDINTALHALIQNTKRNHVLCEHGGPGCPDIWRKDLWFTYFDNEYKASFQCPLNSETTSLHCVELYDLKNDPEEVFKLSNRRHKNIVSHITAIVNKRRNYLLSKYPTIDSFISDTTYRTLL